MKTTIIKDCLISKLQADLAERDSTIRDAIAALEKCGNSPTARLDARAYAKRFRKAEEVKSRADNNQ